MNEIQFHNPDQVQNVRQKQQESKEKIIGRILPKKGHTLWEINMREETITKAEFKDEYIEVINAETKRFVKRRKLIHKPHCCYVSCLRKKNIPKHLKRTYGIEIELNE
jgi:hypothetical protein